MSSDEYQRFLQHRHATMLTPDIEVAKAVKEATGSEIAYKIHIIKGETNEIYDVTTHDGQIIIVRIAHEDLMRFQREKWALNQCKTHNIPTPSVLLWKEQNIEGQKKSFMVLTKIIGKPLETIMLSADKETLQHCLHRAGETLAKIHAIPTNGFGDLDGNGTTPVKSLCEYIHNMKKK